MEEILIKELPLEERPRERLLEYGAGALSNAELLAIVLRTGIKKQSVLNLAKTILKQTDGLKHLNEISITELTQIPGVGPSKAVQMLASIELGKRVSQSLVLRDGEVETVGTPRDCFILLGNDEVFKARTLCCIVFGHEATTYCEGHSFYWCAECVACASTRGLSDSG